MKKRIVLLISGFFLLLCTALLIFITRSKKPLPADLEKSIAVLPFKNDSSDSSNIYLINGLMESLLDNLQKIEDLRVISRISVEKYRHNPNSSLVINILSDFYTGFVPDTEKYLEFRKILPRIVLKFWKYHKKVKDSLKQKELL